MRVQLAIYNDKKQLINDKHINRMKHTKLLLLILAMLMPMMANADPVEINGIFYNLIESKRQAQVQSIPTNFSGEAIIPESVEYEGVSYIVSSIGGGAFSERDGLTSVSIPNSVKSIGARAFIWSYNLATVKISDLTAWCNIDFEDESSNPFNYAQHIYINGEELDELVIPNDVTSIRDYAFINCKCTSVILPDGLTTIGKLAFKWCNMSSITIPSSVSSIDQCAFMNCPNLASIVIPNSLSYIGYMAFCGCSSLTSVVIPNSVTSIGQSAFQSCI